MRVLACPDKFKGSLSAKEVCDHIEAGLRQADTSIEVIKLPLADGGEGTLEVLKTLMPLKPVSLTVLDPLMRPVKASYYTNGKEAFIEMAAASGLQLLKEAERNCMHTTTYGTGQLIADALKRKVKEVFLFVGGSATNDAGIGMAEALGYTFRDKNEQVLPPVGRNLIHICDFEKTNGPDLAGITFHVVTDVKNTCYGRDGAAHVYAGQKGAAMKEIKWLDRGLQNFCELVKEKQSIDLQQLEGTGAAGGLGGGAVAFLNARIKHGIDTVLQLAGFESKLHSVDLVITGEGKLDSQTLHGKVIDGVLKVCRPRKMPVVVICGINELKEEAISQLGIKAVLPLADDTNAVEYAMRNAGQLLEKRMADYIRS